MSPMGRGGGCLTAAAALLFVPLVLLLAPMVLLAHVSGPDPAAYAALLAEYSRTADTDGTLVPAAPGTGGVVTPPSGGSRCGGTVPSPFPVPLAPPLPARVSEPFGWHVDPLGRGRRCHTGLDLAAPMSTPIRAAAAGVVAGAGWGGSYGLLVQVDHGRGVQTWYGHLSRIAVADGQHVNQGDVLGYVGSTGLSTGPHLHLEVRVDGTVVDPYPLVYGSPR